MSTVSHEEMLETLDVGIITSDGVGRVTYANQAALRLVGLSESQILGKTSFDIGWNVVDPEGHPVPPDSLPPSRALTTGRAVREVVLGIYRPRTDDRIWLLTSATPKLAADGTIQMVVLSLSDISTRRALEDILRRSNDRLERRVADRTAELQEMVLALRDEIRWRREAQLALAEREARFRSVVRSMAEGVMVLDAEGQVVEVNPAACEMLGIDRSEALVDEDSERRWNPRKLGKRPLPVGLEPLQSALQQDAPVRSSILGLKLADGTRRWVSVNIEPLSAGDQERSGRVLTLADVTERYLAQQALEQSLEQLELLMAALPGVFLYQVLIPSSGPAELHYLSPGIDSLLGKNVSERLPFPMHRSKRVIHPDDWTMLERALDPSNLDETDDIDGEFRFRVGGEQPWRWVSLRARKQRTEEGTLWNGTGVDVDERHRISEALRKTQKMEAVGVLAAGVAHNFNNMLAAIIPNVEQARPHVAPSFAPYLEDALEAARHAGDLVRQLLVAARRTPERPTESVDLAKLVRGTADLCRRTMGPNIEVLASTPSAPCWVKGSPANLSQVVLNLCTNAHDAMRQKPGRSRLELRIVYSEEHWILTVQDDGEGMPAEVVARIGEPFFTTKGPDRGTGLGVATALGIVQDHGGTLTYESQPNEGTRATVRLPALVDGVPPRSTSAESTEGARPVGKIMVVDDEPLVRRAVRRPLENDGHEVIEASDGETAVELLRDNDRLGVDMVFLDVAMPGLSGPQVLERVAAMHPKLPVVLMTGMLHQDMQRRQVSGILQKPVASEKLRELVATFLAQRTP